MNKKWFFLLFAILILTACGKEQSTNNGKLNVYTTVYPLQFFTEQIGGEYVEVHSIYPPGTDEHTFEPSQKDMMNLADADLFFYIGYNLEGFATKAESTLKNEGVKTIAIGEEIAIEEQDHEDHDHGETEDGHDHGDVDPHLWLDPIYANELANNVLNHLIEQEPEHEAQFKENYAALTEKLSQLHTRFQKVTENAKNNKFIVAHAAYGYWESRYGLEQIAISGISSTEEPSQKKLASIVDTVKNEKIPYILFEQNVNSHLAEVIQEETNTEALQIHNLAVLTEKEIQNNETYFTLMDRNVEVLEKALNK